VTAASQQALALALAFGGALCYAVAAGRCTIRLAEPAS
jgi:hypothetical protein